MIVRELLSGISRPGAKWPRWDRLQILYQTVIKRQPESCVEYGSGWSTLAIAAALKANGKGFLVSYDAMPEWAALTTKNLAELDLGEHAMVIGVDVGLLTMNDAEGWRYLCAPPKADLVHVDGPKLTSANQVTHDPVVDGPRKGCLIVVDGRNATCGYYDKQFTRLNSKQGLTFYECDTARGQKPGAGASGDPGSGADGDGRGRKKGGRRNRANPRGAGGRRDCVLGSDGDTGRGGSPADQVRGGGHRAGAGQNPTADAVDLRRSASASDGQFNAAHAAADDSDQD